ncbi:21318_t:CDS:2, partial [Racocetra persica]
MKFGKLLQTESVPEWKKKYIDYKGLKAKLEKVQQAQYIEPESPTAFFGTTSSIYDSPITYEHSNNLQTFPFSPIKEKGENNENSNLEIIKPSLSNSIRPHSL